MIKKTLMMALLLMVSFNIHAQWKITGYDKADRDNIKLLQIINLDGNTYVYGTLTNDKDEVLWGTLNRKTCVYANDEKYKLVSSVNLPIMDEADAKWVRLDEPGQQVNFVMIFEEFPVKDGFDLVENEKNKSAWNIYGIHVEEIQPSEVIKTARFLDAHTVVTQGIFAESGSNHRYFIRDKVSVDCQATTRDGGDLFACDDIMFTLNIINESDHGIRFDFSEKVWITGTKKKSNGTVETKALTKYSPSSYEQYLRDEDYQEAKYATNGGLAFLDSKLKSESYRYGNSDWAKVGFKMLSSLTEQVMDNSIQSYLNNHPKDRPSALKTQSIKSGESYYGFVAGKTKNMDTVTLHVQMDDYVFEFSWDIK